MPVANGFGGVPIHYEDVGHGDACVVLIQGLSLSGRFWFDTASTLLSGGNTTRVLTVDNRGTGQSGRPFPPYFMTQLAVDVLNVLDHARVQKAILVGVSLGGMVAQHVALSAPHRVSGLCLMCTTPGLPHGSLPSVEALSTLVRLPFMRREAASRAFGRLFMSRSRPRPPERAMLNWNTALRSDPVNPLTFMAQLGAAALHSTGFMLPALRVPTVVMAGEEDALIPANNARSLARLIPGAQLDILPEIGHALYLMDETAVARAVRRLGG